MNAFYYNYLMQAISHYASPLGKILITADDAGVTGLWFQDQQNTKQHPQAERTTTDEFSEADAFCNQTKHWLDIYFSGQEPDFMPPLHLGGTPFQLAVWQILRQIPYGQTMTYGEIAQLIAAQHNAPQADIAQRDALQADIAQRNASQNGAARRNHPRMSAQAVGGAVGRNPIALLVPCHRVVGANGKLTGYAGGVDRKAKLLALEKADTNVHL